MMLHRLILKVTKYQFPSPERLSTVIKNFFFWGGEGGPNRIKVVFKQHVIVESIDFSHNPEMIYIAFFLLFLLM